MGTIQISGLTRAFAGTTAVDAVDLTIEDGDFLVLLGPSGCGKTTLLRMLAGLLEPTAGSILIDGRDVTREPSKKRDLAMVFQSYALYPHLSVEKNLAFPLRVQRLGKGEIGRRVREVADMLEIGHLLRRKPKALSGGQRQRVAVGRALVRQPRAFLMDEPLSNLDAKLRTATRHELTQLHRRLRATFVYVTHDQVEAMTMATRIAVLDGGRLQQVGTPEEVYDRPATRFVAGFLGSPAMNLLPGAVDSAGGRVRLTAPGITGLLWPGETPEVAVTLGVRPEHLRPLAAGDTAAVEVHGVVETVENLGNEEIAYVRIGEEATASAATVAMRGPRGSGLREGESVRLGAALDRLHLFDAQTGARLEWVDEPADASSAATAPERAAALV